MSMHTYVIERELPGAGELTEAELHTIATKSNAVIADMNAQPRAVGAELRHRRQDLLHLPRGERRVAARHARAGASRPTWSPEVKSFFDPTTGD